MNPTVHKSALKRTPVPDEHPPIPTQMRTLALTYASPYHPERPEMLVAGANLWDEAFRLWDERGQPMDTENETVKVVSKACGAARDIFYRAKAEDEYWRRMQSDLPVNA